MRTIRIAYQNMWGHAAAFNGNYLHECFPYLRGHFNFELSGDPQLVFYSVYDFHKKIHPTALRVLYSGECGDWFAHGGKTDPKNAGNVDATFFDYGITCSHSARPENHLYMPQGLLHLNFYNYGVQSLVRGTASEGWANTREFFCNFIYSNANSQDRILFMHALSRYKRVECCGAIERNNEVLLAAGHGYDRGGYLAKQAFQRRCKFSIAMENNYAPGYNTEKLTDAFVARSVPIYAGDPDIAKTFNPDAFINIADYASCTDAIEWIKRVDQDDELYQTYLDAPPFVGNVIPERFTDAYALAFWQKMLGKLL